MQLGSRSVLIVKRMRDRAAHVAGVAERSGCALVIWSTQAGTFCELRMPSWIVVER
jgi:hypothetical protein